ncbi:hypothetical protein AWB74_05814 [Caballeronia arvi]|uniref:Uncharacterized protein n=1 Tax=Caballeronia arvi TaxID=1777135 RepID=A0A158KID0_9BURK|nr:hypothetical protein AWB74_05814 [Caballeronia arvi]
MRPTERTQRSATERRVVGHLDTTYQIRADVQIREGSPARRERGLPAVHLRIRGAALGDLHHLAKATLSTPRPSATSMVFAPSKCLRAPEASRPKRSTSSTLSLRSATSRESRNENQTRPWYDANRWRGSPSSVPFSAHATRRQPTSSQVRLCGLHSRGTVIAPASEELNLWSPGAGLIFDVHR